MVLDKNETLEKAMKKICSENKIPQSHINSLLSQSDEIKAVITNMSKQELWGLLSEIPEDKIEYFKKIIEEIR